MREDILMPQELAGLKFRNPLIVASGPASKNVDQLVAAEEAGWGGVSIKLTIDPHPYINPDPRYRWLPEPGYHIFTAERRLNLKQGLNLVEEARKKTKEIIIFANITYFGDKGLKGWAELGKKFEDGGAHAIEINFCCPNMSFNLDEIGERKEDRPSTGASLGSNPKVVGAIVKTIKDNVNTPVVAKLTPEGGRIGETAKAAIEVGADAVSGTANRLGVPPLDIYNPDNLIYRLQTGNSLGCLSGPWLKPLALKDVLQMRKSIGSQPVIIGTGGIRNLQDVVEMVMVGADFIGICTEVMLKGFGVLPKIIKDVKRYLKEIGKESLSQVRDATLPYFKTADQISLLSGFARVNAEVCTGCGNCARIGHCYAIKMVNKKAVIDKEKCLACSTCMDLCPKDAIQMVESERQA